MGKNNIHISSDLDPEEFRQWHRDSVDDAKRSFKAAVRAWDTEMNINIPVGGDPHKKKALEGSVYYAGLLKESKTLDFDESDDHIEATIQVGQTEGYEQVDYVRYVAARNGVDLFRGQSEAVESIDEALRHGRAEDI